MQTLSVTPPAPRTAAAAHAPRELALDEAEGVHPFEQALEQELALIMPPDAARPVLPDVPVPATDAALVLADAAVLIDGAPLADTLIAAAIIVPNVGVLPTGGATLAAALPAMLPAALPAARPGGRELAPTDTAALAFAAPPAPQKTGGPRVADAVLAAAEAPASDPAETPDVRGTRAPRIASGLHEASERSVRRVNFAPEEASAEPLLAAFGTERAAPADAPPTSPHVSSQLDTLSSAALMSRWTPAARAADQAPAPATAHVDTPFGTDGWNDAFQQKIVWLVDRQQQTAELHLNPPNLGPVEIVLNMSDDGARIAFVSPHAAVRDAIEASLADLRTALNERGLAMGEALVSADSGSARERFQQEAAQAAAAARHARGAAALPGDLPGDTPRVRASLLGLVDTFA